MTPRALVVRSGAVSMPFPRPSDPERLEIVEKVSHTVTPLAADLSPLDEPARLAVFTSQIAVRAMLEDAERARRFRDCLRGGQVAAVGDATAETLRSLGVEPDLVAAGSGRSVLDRLPDRIDGWRVLLPRGSDATSELPEGLAARGARLAPLVLYTKTPRPRDPQLDREIEERPFAVFFASSPSAARWLLAGAPAGIAARLRETPAVALGRFTERYLDSHGVGRVEIAPEASFFAALELMEELAGAPRPA